MLERAAVQARATGDRELEAAALVNLSTAARMSGDLAQAQKDADQAIATLGARAENVGATAWLARAEASLALQEYDAALEASRSAQGAGRQAMEILVWARAVEVEAEVLVQRGDARTAAGKLLLSSLLWQFGGAPDRFEARCAKSVEKALGSAGFDAVEDEAADCLKGLLKRLGRSPKLDEVVNALEALERRRAGAV